MISNSIKLTLFSLFFGALITILLIFTVTDSNAFANTLSIDSQTHNEYLMIDCVAYDDQHNWYCLIVINKDGNEIVIDLFKAKKISKLTLKYLNCAFKNKWISAEIDNDKSILSWKLLK